MLIVIMAIDLIAVIGGEMMGDTTPAEDFKRLVNGYSSSDMMMSFVSVLICLADICLYKIWGHVFETVNKVGDSSEDAQ